MPKKEGQLKIGYTTGTCAAGAAKSALMALISKKAINIDKIKVTLPRSGKYGESAILPIHKTGYQENFGYAEIIKDAGDDPDVTNGAIIRAEVFWNSIQKDNLHIEIDGGQGIGRVTKSGLPVDIGEPAINPVPRKMIKTEISEILEEHKIRRSVKVIISVPDGERIARLTMNARLGISGGISILGTRGVVIPFSTGAYRASVALAIRAAGANDLRHMVITTGGRSENYAMQYYPDLDPMSFLEAGEYIGFSLKKCVANNIQKISIAGMMGKLSKLAAGEFRLHSSRSSIDFSFLAKIAEEAGASPELSKKIKSANTAGEVGEWMRARGPGNFFNILTMLCCKACFQRVQEKIEIEILLFSPEGELLGKTSLSSGGK